MQSRLIAILVAVAGLGCGSDPSAPNAAGVAAGAAPPTTPAPTPAPAPTPTPSPSPRVTGPSDVAYLLLLNYGKCVPGRPFTITPGCRHIEATATPKQANGLDATRHGKNLVWHVNGVVIPDDAAGIDAGCVLVAAGPNELTFNRSLYRKDDGACTARIDVVLWDPQAQEHRAEATLVVE